MKQHVITRQTPGDGLYLLTVQQVARVASPAAARIPTGSHARPRQAAKPLEGRSREGPSPRTIAPACPHNGRCYPAPWNVGCCGYVEPAHDDMLPDSRGMALPRRPPPPRTSLVLRLPPSDNAQVPAPRLAAVALAAAATAAVAGCTAHAQATRPTAHAAQVPNPAQITHFDLVAYDSVHPSSASTSRLLTACVAPDQGKFIQVGVAQSLPKLGVARQGQGVAVHFQSGSTIRQRQAVAECLRANGASLAR